MGGRSVRVEPLSATGYGARTMCVVARAACAEGEFRELAYVQHSISATAPPSVQSAAELVPLHQQAPVVEVSVDNAPLVELSLEFEQWNDERAEPAEPEPGVGVVVSEGSDLTLDGPYPADATVTLFRLDESLRFVQAATLEWNGTDVTVPGPAVGRGLSMCGPCSGRRQNTKATGCFGPALGSASRPPTRLATLHRRHPRSAPTHRSPAS